ncbi:MAG: hypothetical protein P8N56_00305 [Schleiferiaceae bacterium]|nr:hypothetical protein [Schleiferiaceae bacterium]
MKATITMAMSIKHQTRKGLLFLTASLGMLSLSVLSCNAPEATPEQKPADQPSRRTGMYEASPLAVAMRSMATDMESLRAKADDGSLQIEEVDAMILAHADMKTAQATKPSDIKASYTGYAEAYLLQLEELKEQMRANASREERLEAFNAALTTCVACHQEHCPGPISRIEKIKVQP